MKKLVLTEKQSEKLAKMVSEQSRSLYDLMNRDPNIHSIQVRDCYFHHRNLTYKGQNVEDITLGWKFNIQYRIDVEWREYGIKGISVYGFQGPKEMDITLSYYPNTNNPDNIDPVEQTLQLPVNWDAVETHQDENLGFFGVDDEIQIDLVNDQQGNIVIDTIHLNTYSF